MMIRCAFVCVVFLALWQHTGAMKPCCLPDQWSANMVATIGEYNRDSDLATIAYADTDYYYDNKNNQVAFREFRDNQSMSIKTHRWTIQQFDKGMQYVIENKTCTPSSLEMKMTPPCIPDDATYFGTHMYPTSIKADVWFFYQDGQKRFTVSQNCMPLALSHITGGDDYVLTTAIYQNVTKGIADPTVFKVPSICNGQMERENEQNDAVVEMEIN